MSASQIVTKLLLADTSVQDLVADRVGPGFAAQAGAFPYILVRLSGENDPQMLVASSKYPQSRVTIEINSQTDASAGDVYRAAVAALQDVTKTTVAGFADVDVVRTETAYSDFNDDRTVYRYVIDFYVRWRYAA